MLGPISPFKVSLEETRSEAARYKTARSEAGLFSSHKAQPFRRYQTPTDKLGPDGIIRRPPGTDKAFRSTQPSVLSNIPTCPFHGGPKLFRVTGALAFPESWAAGPVVY